ncbi:MAG: hypothetical protein GY798_02895 [Hyphomicrobiales bacterium]|nr:hypothetical protein [Hyphomicrobiales bacterium]
MPSRRLMPSSGCPTTAALTPPKDFDADYDAAVGVQFAPDHGFLFDTGSGARLDARMAPTG